MVTQSARICSARFAKRETKPELYRAGQHAHSQAPAEHVADPSGNRQGEQGAFFSRKRSAPSRSSTRSAKLGVVGAPARYEAARAALMSTS